MDPADVLCAAYRIDLDAQSWLDGVTRALAPRFDAEFPVQSHISTLRSSADSSSDDMTERFLALHLPPDEPLLTAFAHMAKRHKPGEVRQIITQLHSEALFSFSEHATRFPLWHGLVRDAGKAAGIELADVFCFFASSGKDTLFVLSSMSRSELVTAPRERRSWLPLHKHIGGALRLRERLCPDTEGHCIFNDPLVEAILDPDGQVYDARRDAQPRATRRTLREAVVGRERCRRQRGVEDPEAALELWQHLVEGRWSLIEHFDTDGRRFLLAVRNDIDAPDPRALRPREREILHLVSQEYSNKEIAANLGISESAVSQHGTRAARKLGATTLHELAHLAGTVSALHSDSYTLSPSNVEADDLPDASLRVLSANLPRIAEVLTESERSVVRLALSGLSRAQVAAERCVSVHTVHNQIASAYQKLGVRSLRELAARV